MPKLNKPLTCSDCPLETISEGFSVPEGLGSIPLLIVGESLGYNEMLEGLPFRPNAPAGSILHRIIQERGKFNRSQFAFWNMIGCHPPNDKLSKTNYEYEAINHCRVHFDQVIKRYNPKVILSLGALPFKHLVGLSGKNTEITKIRGYCFKSSRYPNVVVVPSIHPSYIRRGNIHLLNVLLLDFIKATNIAQGKHVDYIIEPFNSINSEWYNTNPSVEDALYFLKQIKENPTKLITYDIETEKSVGEDEDELKEYGSQISQIQFSTNKNEGIAFPYCEPFISIAKSILSSNNPKAGHNVWDFDNPILLSNGFTINGRIDDTMWMFHHYQADLPLNLQFVSSFYNFPFPWKHYASSNLAFYGIADVDSVQYIMSELPEQLRTRGLWEGYNKYVYGLKPILRNIENRGLPINISKQKEFGEEILIRESEIELELKEMVSDSFNKYSPINGYAKEPKELASVVQGFIVENSKLPTELEIEEIAKSKFRLVKRKNKEGYLRWFKEESFNPNSPDQVSEYIKSKGDEQLARKIALQMGKKKDENKEDKNKKDNVITDKNVLKKLKEKTGNEVYDKIIEYKELVKMNGTYIDGYKGDSNGRIHTTFTFRPSSGQLSSRNPNIQNYPVHSRLAGKFKETIEAKEGYLLVSLDYRGFHNKMMGYLSGDTVYERLAGLDTHSYLTGYVVGWPMEGCLELDDEKLLGFLKGIKAVYKKLRDDQVKHVVHGINFGLSENGCYDRYGEDFNPSSIEVIESWNHRKKPNELFKKGDSSVSCLQHEIILRGRKKVKDIYSLLKKLFPKVFEWQEKTLVEADKGWLDTKFGARRWFPAASEVSYYSNGNVSGRKKGEQSEEALAYPVSNSSHYHMRESMIICEEKGYNEEFNLVNMIHDSLIYEVEEGKLRECIEKVIEVMERESEVLEGFWCKVDVKYGKNMDDMKEL